MYVFGANEEEEEEEGWNEEASRKVRPFVRVSRSTFSSNFSFLSPVCFVVSKIFIPPSLLFHRSVATWRKKRRPRLVVTEKNLATFESSNLSEIPFVPRVKFHFASLCGLLLLRWKSGTTIVTHRAKVRITEFIRIDQKNSKREEDFSFIK